MSSPRVCYPPESPLAPSDLLNSTRNTCPDSVHSPEPPRPPLPTGFRSGPRVGVAGFFCEDPGGRSFRLRGRVVFRTGSGTGSGTHLLSPAVGAGDSAEAERRGGRWTSPMDSEFHPSSTCHELLPFHSLPPPSSSPVSAAGQDRTRRRVGRVCCGAAVGHQSRNVPPQRAWGQRGARTVLATCLEEVCASAFPGPRAPERTG